MNAKQSSTITMSLMATLAFVPAVGFAATYSGEAVALKASALGINVALADTGALPSTGGNLSTSLARVNLLGLVSAEALSSTTSGSGTSSQSQSSVTDVNLLGGLVAADVVKSNSGASCSGSTASVTGNSELVRLVALGQPIAVSSPN